MHGRTEAEDTLCLKDGRNTEEDKMQKRTGRSV